MAQYNDFTPAAQQGWIHELARAEIHPDAERILNLGRPFDPQQVVEESTIDFMMELRERFNEYARIFNGYSENAARFQEIKIYSIAHTPADFMIFRNSIKLMVTHQAHGVIQLSFAQHMRGNMDINGQNHDAPAANPIAGQSQELIAQVGPFRDVWWTFQNEKVSPDQVAKFYFAEFSRVTREQKPQRGNNQALLEQIRGLLEERGIQI